jgi:hypothetical protein
MLEQEFVGLGHLTKMKKSVISTLLTLVVINSTIKNLILVGFRDTFVHTVGQQLVYAHAMTNFYN